MGYPEPIRHPERPTEIIGVRTVPVWNCLETCGDPRGRLQAREQATKRCTLLRYSGRWEGDEPHGHMGHQWMLWYGRPPLRHLAGEPKDVIRLHVLNMDLEHPSEEPGEGCPGGWIHTRYVESLLPYLRQRTSTGLHDTNPLVHADTAPKVLEALRYFEAEEAAAHSHVNRVRYGHL